MKMFKYLGRLYDHEDADEDDIDKLATLLENKNVSTLEMMVKV